MIVQFQNIIVDRKEDKLAMWKEGIEYLKIENGPVIFCCSQDPMILNIASKIAKERNVRIFHYIDPDDLMAIPFDIALIDRELLKKGIWENFIAWQKDLYENNQPDDAIYILLNKELFSLNDVPIEIKQLPIDFENNYRNLFNFLDKRISILINEIW